MAMSDVITEQRAEKAYRILSDYREVCRAETLFRRLDCMTKHVESEAYLRAEGKNIPEREHKARTDEDYKAHKIKVEDAREAYMLLKMQWEHAKDTVDWWRSVHKRQTQGH